MQMDEVRKRIGVTRLAGVTGLDRIGLPVAAAIRPLSRNLTVSFGKGADHGQAGLSAVMEAVELFFSEAPPGPLLSGCHAGLRHEGAVDPSVLAHVGDTGADLSRTVFDWVAGENLQSAVPVLVPWCMVAMDFTPEVPSVAHPLRFGATGLAAGFDKDRAIVHGLCEVIERDAHRQWNSADDRTRAATLLDLDTIASESVNHLMAMVRDAGLELLIWDATGKTGVPCYLAEIFDTAPHATTAYAQGAAADLSPQAALIKAIMEAIQVRLTYISGGRDDLEWSDYGDRYGGTAANRRWIAQNLRPQRRVAAEPVSTGDSLAELRRRLALADCGDILCVRLTGPVEPVYVVKVIVPALRDIDDVAAPVAETVAA